MYSLYFVHATRRLQPVHQKPYKINVILGEKSLYKALGNHSRCIPASEFLNAGNFQCNINKRFQHDLLKKERRNLGRIRRNLCTFFFLLFTRNLFEDGF